MTLPDFKIYHKVTVIKIMWCWGKQRLSHQQNRERPQDRAHKYSQMIFGKGKRRVSSANDGETTLHPHTKE